jgi:signal transduction histidine kinase
LACVSANLTLHQDLTRVESGHETMFNEPFDLSTVITEATSLYKHEAQRKGLDFEVDLAGDLRMVVGDSSKVRTVVANLTANARKEPSFLIFFNTRGLHLCQ